MISNHEQQIKETANRIYKTMFDRGMSQRELAEKVGVTEVTMSRYVNGKRAIRATNLIRLADALCVSVDYLLGLED